MAYNPISGFTLQVITSTGQVASDYYLKFYEANTTTPLSMATDSSGTTLLTKAKIGDKGMPVSNPLDNSTVFIPHVNASYRLVIYTSEADADANNTAEAYVNVPFVSTLLGSDSIGTGNGEIPTADLIGDVEVTATGTTTPRSLADRFGDVTGLYDFSVTPDGDSLNSAVNLGKSVEITQPATFALDQAQAANVLNNIGLINTLADVTITLPLGSIALTTPTVVDHDLSRLRLIGQTPIAVNITSQASVSGSQGDYLVTLNVSDSSGAEIGNYLHTKTTVGLRSDIHRGCWEITSIPTATSIVVRNTCQRATFPTNTITSSTSVIIRTILRYQSCDGILVTSGNLGLLDNVVIAGNADDYWSSGNVTGTEIGTHGILVGSQTVAVNGKADNENEFGISGGSISCGPNVGVTSFDQQGVVTENGGSFWGDFVSSCNNKRRGFYASTGSAIRAKHISSNGNYLDGVISDIGGSIYASSESCASGNGQRGVAASQAGSIIFDTGITNFNGNDGAAAVAGGVLQMTNSESNNNNGSGFRAEYGSTIYSNNSTSEDNSAYGLYLAFQCTSRSSSMSFSNNTSGDIRSDSSVVVASGATFSNPIVSNGGIVVDGSTVYSGVLKAPELRITDVTTNKGQRLATTSGGDNLLIQHDVNGLGAFSTSYNFRSNDQGFYPEDDYIKNLGRSGNAWRRVYTEELHLKSPDNTDWTVTIDNSGNITAT